MRLYWEVTKRAFRRYSTYRAATWAGVFTNTVFGFIRAGIFLAVYRHRVDVGGYDVTDALTYTFLGQALLMPIGSFGTWEISTQIRSGDVATDLFRPFDFQRYWMAQDAGRAAYHLLARGIPPLVIGALVFPLRMPAPHRLPAVVAALVLAWWVSFGIRFLFQLSTFWLLDHRGVAALYLATLFLGGHILPLAFFPDRFAAVARALPFAASYQTPIDVFLDQPVALWPALVWAAVLTGCGRLVLRAGVRKLVVQGG